jgi:hypothetical protein
MDTQSVKEVLGAAAMAAAPILGILLLYWHGRRREIWMLQNWARENHFELLSFRQRRFFEPAPFWFLSGHRTPAYLVTIRDEQGKQRSAWIRLGTLWEGICWGGKHVVTVKWNEVRTVDA